MRAMRKHAWISLNVMRLSTSTQIIRATRSLAWLLTDGRNGQEYLPARAPKHVIALTLCACAPLLQSPVSHAAVHEMHVEIALPWRVSASASMLCWGYWVIHMQTTGGLQPGKHGDKSMQQNQACMTGAQGGTY